MYPETLGRGGKRSNSDNEPDTVLKKIKVGPVSTLITIYWSHLTFKGTREFVLRVAVPSKALPPPLLFSEPKRR